MKNSVRQIGSMESLISRTDQVQVRISSLGKVDKLDHLVKEKVQDRKCGNSGTLQKDQSYESHGWKEENLGQKHRKHFQQKPKINSPNLREEIAIKV